MDRRHDYLTTGFDEENSPNYAIQTNNRRYSQPPPQFNNNSVNNRESVYDGGHNRYLSHDYEPDIKGLERPVRYNSNRQTSNFRPPPVFNRKPTTPEVPNQPYSLLEEQRKIFNLRNEYIDSILPPLPEKPIDLVGEINSMLNSFDKSESINNLVKEDDPIELKKNQLSERRKDFISPRLKTDEYKIDIPEVRFDINEPIHSMDGPMEASLTPSSQRRKSLSQLSTLENQMSVQPDLNEDIPGLLSNLISNFKPNSYEIMTGAQIIETILDAAHLNELDRGYGFKICKSLERLQLFKNTVDEELPILDGEDEIYVVDIGRLQKPKFLPTGVLTYLTKCYYPTCTPKHPCNSKWCPTNKLYTEDNVNEIEVLKLVDIKVPIAEPAANHKKSLSHTNLNQTHTAIHVSQQPMMRESSMALEAELWIRAVPQSVVDSVSPSEKKRQELIFETIKTEQDFVTDLKLIDIIFVKPLIINNIYDRKRVDAVLTTLFHNYKDILYINSTLLDNLKKIQASSYVVESVGDVFLSWAKDLDPYVQYGGQLAYAQDFIKRESELNPEFQKFLRECEQHPDSRRLSIQSFVGRATTRLGRYPLLLEAILKKTDPDNKDCEIIPRVLDFVKETLAKINKLAGQADSKLKINFINSHLFFKPEDFSKYNELESNQRKFIKEGTLKMVSGHSSQSIKLFLFDNIVILAKEKKKDTIEYRAITSALPLNSLEVTDEVVLRASSLRPAEQTLRQSRTSTETSSVYSPPLPDVGFHFSITNYRRKVTTYTLQANTAKERSSWTEAILAAIERCPEVSCSVAISHEILSTSHSLSKALASTTASTPNGRRYLFGKDDGVYLLTENGLRRIIATSDKVIQLEALPEYNVLVVLGDDKNLMAYHLDVISDPSGKLASSATKISENVSFFRVGIYQDRKLLLSTKYNAGRSIFKVMELVNLGTETRASSKNKLLWQSRHRTGLRVVKKFYVGTIANNVCFLKKRLSVACGPGFEIVDLERLAENKSIPDQQSPPIAGDPFFTNRFVSCTPIGMYRVNRNEFLLCYREFGLYVDNSGKPSRINNSFLDWENTPNRFVLVDPYLISFASNLVEVFVADTGKLVQTVIAPNGTLGNPTSVNGDDLHILCEQPNNSESQRVFRLEILTDISQTPSTVTTNNLSYDM